MTSYVLITYDTRGLYHDYQLSLLEWPWVSFNDLHLCSLPKLCLKPSWIQKFSFIHQVFRMHHVNKKRKQSHVQTDITENVPCSAKSRRLLWWSNEVIDLSGHIFSLDGLTEYAALHIWCVHSCFPTPSIHFCNSSIISVNCSSTFSWSFSNCMFIVFKWSTYDMEEMKCYNMWSQPVLSKHINMLSGEVLNIWIICELSCLKVNLNVKVNAVEVS